MPDMALYFFLFFIDACPPLASAAREQENKKKTLGLKLKNSYSKSKNKLYLSYSPFYNSLPFFSVVYIEGR